VRGQSSLEYLLIIGVALIILASITVIRVINPASEGSSDVMRVSQARSTCDSIADMINGVYGDAQGATRTIVVHLSGTWNLRMTKSPANLSLSISVSYGTENLVDNLRYSFNGSLLTIPGGSYPVIVDWPSNGNEGISMMDNKIYIHINPPTGGEK
jgi:hypothetical protein